MRYKVTIESTTDDGKVCSTKIYESVSDSIEINQKREGQHVYEAHVPNAAPLVYLPGEGIRTEIVIQKGAINTARYIYVDQMTAKDIVALDHDLPDFLERLRALVVKGKVSQE